MGTSLNVDKSTRERLYLLAKEHGVSPRTMLRVILDALDLPEMRKIVGHLAKVNRIAQEWDSLYNEPNHATDSEAMDRKLSELQELAAISQTFVQNSEVKYDLTIVEPI